MLNENKLVDQGRDALNQELVELIRRLESFPPPNDFSEALKLTREIYDDGVIKKQIINPIRNDLKKMSKRLSELANDNELSVDSLKEVIEEIKHIDKMLEKVLQKPSKEYDFDTPLDALKDKMDDFFQKNNLQNMEKKVIKLEKDNLFEKCRSMKKFLKDKKPLLKKVFFDKVGIDRAKSNMDSSFFSFTSDKNKLKRVIKESSLPKELEDKVVESLNIFYVASSLVQRNYAIIKYFPSLDLTNKNNNKELNEEDRILEKKLSEIFSNDFFKSAYAFLMARNLKMVAFEISKSISTHFELNLLLNELKWDPENHKFIKSGKLTKDEKDVIQKDINDNLQNLDIFIKNHQELVEDTLFKTAAFDISKFLDQKLLAEAIKNDPKLQDEIKSFHESGGYVPSVREKFEKLIVDDEKRKEYEKSLQAMKESLIEKFIAEVNVKNQNVDEIVLGDTLKVTGDIDTKPKVDIEPASVNMRFHKTVEKEQLTSNKDISKPNRPKL